MKSGFISVVGRPNVGKSTLINSIVGKKVAITSNKPQTTRNIIKGIYNEADTQIVFIDTPGIHKPNSKLGKVLNNSAYYSLDDSDAIIFMVDASGLGKGDLFILDKIKSVNKPVLLVINKIDLITNEKLIELIKEYNEAYPFKEIIPVSGLKRKNLTELIKTIKTYLTDDIRYYDEGTITDRKMKFLIPEIVREKIFNLTKDEVPHTVNCVMDSMVKNNNSYNIIVSIIVSRESIKGIIIGSRGDMIKKIGMLARRDIESLLGRKVYLELFVKVVKKWNEKEKYLNEYGFNEYNE